MPKKKTELEHLSGKLISAIQKEWGLELGEPHADITESVMGKAHDLLQSTKCQTTSELLSGMSVTQFLGDIWIQKHSNIKQQIFDIENELKKQKMV